MGAPRLSGAAAQASAWVALVGEVEVGVGVGAGVGVAFGVGVGLAVGVGVGLAVEIGPGAGVGVVVAVGGAAGSQRVESGLHRLLHLFPLLRKRRLLLVI